MNKLILAAALATLVGFSLYKMSVSGPAVRDDHIDRMMFNQWLMQNGKSYGNDDEKEYRYQNFKVNIEIVESNTSDSYELGLNQFADLNEEEFIAQNTGYENLLGEEDKNYVSLENIEAPSSKDWVSLGKVNSVQNQGSCGSCWAFSATAALETRYALDRGSLPKFSEQALVDCGRETGNNGCSGGLMGSAFKWSARHGMASSRDYPYTARNGTCRISSKRVTHVNTSYSYVQRNNNSELVRAISQSVISVAIAANRIQLYRGGIFNNWGCGTQLNHGVAAVGYGQSGGKMFYKVRNSWGSGWGEGGYIRMERRSSGTGICGITMQASYPTS